ncbi:MAG: ABC transporter ATP-binding protein [Chlamydiales bacterium]|nr:ABC transporter ATP-binding protein [Chlamydiales bacterium]
MEQPLVIDRLCKNYGQLEAAKEISFSLEAGEIFGLLGPNGAGKTTTISCITTLETPTSGSIQVFGHNVIKKPQLTKRCIGYVPQELISHGFFTVEELLVIHSSYFGITNNKPYIHHLLHKLDLFEQRKKHVKQLSGGMKRRLLIAKALVHKPKLLLLDEPTAGVDIELRSQLWEFVREMQNEGTTVLLTTHYLEEAEKLCNRVGILFEGKLRTIGHTSGLIEELTQREIILSLSQNHRQISHPYLKLQKERTLIFLVPKGYELKKLLGELNLTLDHIRDIHIREGNLEDAFQHVLQARYEN